jgi:hypothetical protein
MLKIFGYSKEHQKFVMTTKCPMCGAYLLFSVPHFYKADGTRISSFTPSLRKHRSAVAECPKCLQRWPVFETSPKYDSEQRQFISTEETERSEEHIGKEQRIIDNSMSSIDVTRQLTVSKEWSQTYAIDYEKASRVGGEVNLGVSGGLNLKLAAEEAIKTKYYISEGIKKTYSEQITFSIKSKTKVRIILDWKLIWQHGIAKFRDQKNQIIEVPFRVVAGVTFDQTQIDES